MWYVVFRIQDMTTQPITPSARWSPYESHSTGRSSLSSASKPVFSLLSALSEHNIMRCSVISRKERLGDIGMSIIFLRFRIMMIVQILGKSPVPLRLRLTALNTSLRHAPRIQCQCDFHRGFFGCPVVRYWCCGCGCYHQEGADSTFRLL